MPNHRRLGRPPASSGEDTRARLVLSARHCFAEYGYAGTSNRHIAEASGLTTGAIYHYFSSKQELYFVAFEGVQELIYDRFRAAVLGKVGLLAELGAVFDEAVVLNREDTSLAGFVVAGRTDGHRYPELAPLLEESAQRVEFYEDVFGRALERGELSPQDAPMVMWLLRVITAGLTFAASDDLEHQAEAVAAVKRLLAGTLLLPHVDIAGN